MWTVAQLAADLAAGRTSSRDLVERALARIADPTGEGARAFLQVNAAGARADADHADRLRSSGLRRSPVDGLPVSLKDLFDVAGEVTRAGSRVFERNAPAAADAPAVARLRAAGAVFIGRTNMVEFAFGGVGLNPHFGTPKNPWDRKSGRVPGGSTSGGAVAQADGMCVMALGSDTRGSVRQPAALCGVAGFKSTARRIPREGAFPLSYTLDSIGPLANSAACCAAYDAILAGEADATLAALPVKGLRLMLPRSSALADLDAEVEKAFAQALQRLSKAGAVIAETAMPAFDRQAEYFKSGGIAAAEALQIHRPHLARVAEYDPRVGKRVLLGQEVSGADYVELVRLRESFIREVESLAAPFDAILMPTTPCVAPTLAEAGGTDEDYFRWNLRIMRNNGLINFLDGCAATLPIHAPGTAPVGLMVCGPAMRDRHVLAAAVAIERALPALDRRAARRNFERAARTYAGASRLEAEVGARMLERLDYVKIAPRRILDAGSGPPQRLLGKRYPKSEVIALDFSVGMLLAGRGRFEFFRKRLSVCGRLEQLPLASASVDLVWSNMALHWAAEPAAALREFERVLAPGGLAMFSTLGPDTLKELRAAAGAERVHAFLDMHDLGDMLVAAGFAAPVMDMEMLTLAYGGAARLLEDLRASGQTNARLDRRRGLAPRGLRQRLRQAPPDASFEVIYGHAWKGGERRETGPKTIRVFGRLAGK